MINQLITKYNFMIYYLIFTLILYINGSVIQNLLNKRQKWKEKDIIINFNIKILFGFVSILSIIALLSIFHSISFLGVILFETIFIIVFFFNKLKEHSIIGYYKDKNRGTYFAVFLIALISLIIHSYVLLNRYIFPGSDLKAHLLLISQILLNKSIPITLEPYLPIFNTYPLGFHAISSFFALVTQFPLPKIITMTGIFAYALLPVAMYHLTKNLTGNKYIAMVSAFLISFFSKELSLVYYWGGIPYLYAIYFGLTFVALFTQVIFAIKRDHFHPKLLISMSYAAFLCLVINPIALFLFSILTIPIFLLNIERNHLKKIFIKYRTRLLNVRFIIFSFVGIIFLIPYLYGFSLGIVRFIPKKYNYLSNIELPKEIASYGINWFSKERLTTLSGLGDLLNHIVSYHGTVLLTMSILAVFLFLLFIKHSSKQTIIPISWLLLLGLMGTNSPTGLYFVDIFGASYIIPARAFGLLLIPLILLSSLSVFFIYLVLKKVADYFKGLGKFKIKVLGEGSIIVLIISLLFISSPTVLDEFREYSFQIPYKGVNEFNVLTDNDLEAMNWISNNTSLEDFILVSWADAGQFIPSYTKRVVIYPWSKLHFDPDYLMLTKEVMTQPDNEETIKHLKKYDIKYVFIGSKTERGRKTFDPVKLHFTDRYIPVFNSRETWVFKVVYEKRSEILNISEDIDSINAYSSEGTKIDLKIIKTGNKLRIAPLKDISRVDYIWGLATTQNILDSNYPIIDLELSILLKENSINKTDLKIWLGTDEWVLINSLLISPKNYTETVKISLPIKKDDFEKDSKLRLMIQTVAKGTDNIGINTIEKIKIEHLNITSLQSDFLR